METHVDGRAADGRLRLRSEIRRVEDVVGPGGGVITSTVVPEVQLIIPAGALKKERTIGLEVQVIDSKLMMDTLGKLTAVSPVVIVEPRGHRFHLPVTLTFPRPFAVDRKKAHLRIFCSIVGKVEWEDIPKSTLVVDDKSVTFSTTTAGRFWIADLNHLEGTQEKLTILYRKAVDVTPRVNNPSRPYKQMRKLERQQKGLYLQLGYIPAHDLAPAPDQPGLLGASPLASEQLGFLGASSSADSIPVPSMMTLAPPLQQGAAASVTPGQLIIVPMSFPQLNGAEVAPPSLVRTSGPKRRREDFEEDD